MIMPKNVSNMAGEKSGRDLSNEDLAVLSQCTSTVWVLGKPTLLAFMSLHPILVQKTESQYKYYNVYKLQLLITEEPTTL